MAANNSILRDLSDNDDESGTRRFKDFFMSECEEELQQMLTSPNVGLFHSLNFSFMDLLDFDPK